MRFVLSKVELELCWDRLGLGELPTILSFPSQGATLDERRALHVAAWRDLERRELASGSELSPSVAGRLQLLAAPEREVDARLRLDDGPRVRALAATRRGHGLLAVLTSDRITVTDVAHHSLPEAVVNLLPAHPAPRARSISLLATELDDAVERSDESPARLERLLHEAGLGHQDARQVREVLGDVQRTGQFGTSARTNRAGRRRGPYAINFYDTPCGRWQFTRRPSPDGRQWATLAPADQPRLVSAVAELLAAT
ncbi:MULTISPECIES: ESX secretion-associated protein EspG [Actinosynnema]|uniref:ESX secretion-associated protein EspG n=1 Tax=Actinosynnema TaxID=40566 RepID=UPI0020A29F53|nr:ESX secretion-associated protein EspG [Actinosynnema pretiosum]MCP2095468.1 EspG family protein [Actinosynnema pretiosum]